MQAPLKKKSDMKILILYLMNKIGYALDYVTLNDMITTDGLMSSFDFTECFAELLDAGNIRVVAGDSGELFAITEQGRRVCESLEGNLLAGIRDRIYKSALSMLDFRQSGRRTDHSVEIVPDKKPVFRCSVSDSSGELFSLRAEVESEDQLARVVNNWEKRPETVYKSILAMLAGDADYIL